MIQLYYPTKELPEPFQSMATINGTKPFKPIITQGFGENAAINPKTGISFYKELGMLGHNGLDYVAPIRTPVYAAHNGTITKTYDVNNASRTIGYGIWITHDDGWFTVYFHLDEVLVKVGDKTPIRVKAGDLIGYADNTGQYTTGSHLHFGLYPANREEIRNNGYDGAINPLLYFTLNQLTQNDMLKIIGDSKTRNQFVQGKNGKIHLIYNVSTLNELAYMGLVNKDDVAWTDDISQYDRAKDLIMVDFE